MKGVYERSCPLVDFPGSPAVKTPCSQCRVVGSVPGWESKIHKPCGQKRGGVPSDVIQSPCLSFTFTELVFSHCFKLLPLCVLNSCLWPSLILDLFFCSTVCLPALVYSFNHCGFIHFRICWSKSLFYPPSPFFLNFTSLFFLMSFIVSLSIFHTPNSLGIFKIQTK